MTTPLPPVTPPPVTSPPVGTVPPVTIPVAPPVAPSRGYDQIYAVGAGPGGGPRVQVFDTATGAKRFDFFAYDSTLRGGVSVATADVTGDGVDDVITGSGYGGAAHVEVFDGTTGALVASWYAYDSDFRGGVWVAAADIDGDGVAEVVTGPGRGGGPVVEVWSLAGGVPGLLSRFAAFDIDSRGGTTVAAWATADGRGVIAVGAGPGGEPRVRTFDAGSLAVLTDAVVYEPTFPGGVYVAAGPSAEAQLLVGPGPGGGPRLVAFAADGRREADVLVDADTARAGLTVASLVRPVGPAQVLFGAGRGAFTGTLTSGTVTDSARAGFFEEEFQGGVFVG